MSTLTYIVGWPLLAALVLAFVPRDFRVIMRALAILATGISALLAIKMFILFPGADAEARFIASYQAVTGDTDSFYEPLALRAYYFATRDINNNGTLDMDFDARRRGEAGELQGAGLPSALPDGSEGYGPMIHPIR